VLWERLGAETVLLDPATGHYTRLNGTGSLLWEALEQPVSAAALAQRLAATAEIAPERAHSDVSAFLESLATRGLIELTPPADRRSAPPAPRPPG
jgi:hypothetical protein